MNKQSYYDYRQLQREKRELRQSLKLHTAGFLTGAAVALEDKKELGEVVGYGIAGVCATLFIELLYPRTANLVKFFL